jgi:hypothetical protein
MSRNLLQLSSFGTLMMAGVTVMFCAEISVACDGLWEASGQELAPWVRSISVATRSGFNHVVVTHLWHSHVIMRFKKT